MDSKEMGLVMAQKILDVEDLHYGFWQEGAIPTIKDFIAAQERYSEVLFGHIEELISSNKQARILDVGCGVGQNIKKLEAMGYQNIEGIIPSKMMIQQCREISEAIFYQCGFEDFIDKGLYSGIKYDLVFFSESFQYVDMEKSLRVLDEILTPLGNVVIFDFFSRDNIDGRSPLGGGHSLGNFDRLIAASNYKIISDLDVTRNVSPNMALVNEVIVNRLIPVCQILDKFLTHRKKIIYGIIKYFSRKKIAKLQFKYSKNRNQENFEKYKIYKLISLKKT